MHPGNSVSKKTKGERQRRENWMKEADSIYRYLQFYFLKKICQGMKNVNKIFLLASWNKIDYIYFYLKNVFSYFFIFTFLIEFEVNKNIINLYTGHQAIKFSSNGGSFMIYENLIFLIDEHLNIYNELLQILFSNFYIIQNKSSKCITHFSSTMVHLNVPHFLPLPPWMIPRRLILLSKMSVTRVNFTLAILRSTISYKFLIFFSPFDILT
ncbi:hypothetical protein IEQ34_017181 [Dendrobium chrysotoxum]|uniref:Maturase K n=1 Tax=Dendrobium chrysotoxum TaxID=161865 RepID=A0AAV7GAN7_DENCH|nr:hypothetical protein IEQ34_017181 [Dendrobium chrysotoxum]